MTITRDNTKIETWFERDRAHVALLDASSEDVLIEWWDEAVQEAVDDGFLDPKDWHGSAVNYANHLGAGRKSNPQLLLVENGKQCHLCGTPKGLKSKSVAGVSDYICPACKTRFEPQHDVLCQCGWGRLAMPESQIPEHCPMCGDTLRRENAKKWRPESVVPKRLADISDEPGAGYLWRCPGCGGISAENWQVQEIAEKRFGVPVKMAHGSAFDNFCGHCGRDWVREDSPIRALVYTHENPEEDYSWECTQCGPGPVRRCDGCRKVARLSPLGSRRGTFLPSEMALNVGLKIPKTHKAIGPEDASSLWECTGCGRTYTGKKGDRFYTDTLVCDECQQGLSPETVARVFNPATLDADSPAVQKADRAFKQWHGGAEAQNVEEWEGKCPGPDKTLMHSKCGDVPAVCFIHSGPECNECAEHTQVVEGKDVTFFGHRVEFSGKQMPEMGKYKSGDKVFITGGGVKRLREKYGDRLGRCPVFEYVVDDIKDSDKHGSHWVHTAHKPYGVWEWSDEVQGYRCNGGVYTATTWLDK